MNMLSMARIVTIGTKSSRGVGQRLCQTVGNPQWKRRLAVNVVSAAGVELHQVWPGHRQGKLLALAPTQPGWQYHQLLCSGSGNQLPQRHAPNHLIVKGAKQH
jgi:hypothetical protein